MGNCLFAVCKFLCHLRVYRSSIKHVLIPFFFDTQQPLTGLWPLAILLTFAALAILSILLKLAWSISRAKLSFFRIYKIHYDIKTSPFSSSSTYTWEESINQHGKSRTLILPAEGSVLLCALVSCIGTIARALSIETSGRVAWLSDFNLVARVVEL